MIKIKNNEEIAKVQRSGKIAAFVLKELQKNIKPGTTTGELDKIANRIIISRGATPSFLNYQNFPASTCISVNDELVHGIPSNKKINSGDLVKIDVGVCLNGFHSDTAISIYLGKPTGDMLRLITGTRQALYDSIRIIRPGIRVGEIEEKTGAVLKKYKLSPVLSLSGHGVGREIHEDPSIKSDGSHKDGAIVKEGMIFAIEPMATLGSPNVRASSDKWTVKTVDGSMAAHFEHTVVVTRTGSKILTR